MLDSGLPPEEGEENPRSVSPLSSLHVSRSSTPGISSLDGTPRYLFAISPPPPPSRLTPSPDMAIKPSQHANTHEQENSTNVKLISLHGTGARVAAEPSIKDLPCQETHEQPSLDPLVPSLSDLSQLLRLERYQAQRCRQIQQQLHRTNTVVARNARLAHTARSVQRTLAECIRSEDKQSFVNLSNAFHDAVSDCSDASKGLVETDHQEAAKCLDYPPSFMDALSSGSRSSLLDFLYSIGHDGDFVADRLAALTYRELMSLLPEKGQPRSNDSIFGSSPRTSSRSSRHLGFVADSQTELLSSSEYGSPLATLIHSVRGIARPSLEGDPETTELWATICSRLISEQKPGSERVVPAVIDSWASASSWPGKERLGMWISQTLQDGSFLLEQPNKQSFRLRVQGRQEYGAEEEPRLEHFYNKAVESLLRVLGDTTGASLIPQGACALCRSIHQKLKHSLSHQHGFPNFVLIRWLFSSFLPDAIALPEINGLFTDTFIADNARQRILREVANRCQKLVFDVVYSWKYGNTVSQESTRLVQSVAKRFEFVQTHAEKPVPGDHVVPSVEAAHGLFVPVSAADINTLVNALYPLRRPTSFSSDRDPSQAGLQSSSSSISGFSLFQSPGAAEPWNRSSFARSEDALPPSLSDASARTKVEGEAAYEPDKSGLQPDWDGERIREACASIEESLTSVRSSASGHWCFLIANSEKHRFTTVRDALSESLNNVVAPSRTTIIKSDVTNYRICRDAIKELLLSGNLITPGDYVPYSTDIGNIVSCVLRAFELRITTFKEAVDFVGAHSWFRKLCSFRTLISKGGHDLLYMLHRINEKTQRSLSLASSLTDSCEAWMRLMKPALEDYNQELLKREESMGHLRDKMWYVADVRTSAIYEEVRSIVSALKVMGKPKSLSRTRLAPPLRHWSASKVSSTGFHLKTEAQILDILSAPPDHGGPNKLSDDQSKTLSSWMVRNAVENLCRGEERLHKLCMEMRKAVDLLTAENSTLLSSTLLARSNRSPTQSRATQMHPFWSPQAVTGRLDLLTLQTNVPSSIDSISNASSHPLSAKSSRDYLESRSPALTNRSSAPFWSPVMTEVRSPSSATSVGSSQTHAAPLVPTRFQSSAPKADNQSNLELLRQHTTALLLSDLASTLFNDGSETDQAFWTGLGGELTEKHLQSLHMSFQLDTAETSPSEGFDYDLAFKIMWERFSASYNPFTKLACLHDIDTLLTPYIAEYHAELPLRRPELPQRSSSLHRLNRHQTSSVADAKVEGFRRLFCNDSLRPAAIFRDLQYIAALVPAPVLESTAQGKAFWNAAVAISGLKQEIRQVMVETADSIIAYQSNNRTHGHSSSTAQQKRDSATFSVPSRTPSAEDIAHYDMPDAAYLLQITAKEGDHVAQRELATLYLTHPEQIDRMIAPFSRPQDVFKEELDGKWRKNQDPNRCDPTTMCVAHHWMSLSSKGGDALAKEYLRQREEMDRLG